MERLALIRNSVLIRTGNDLIPEVNDLIPTAYDLMSRIGDPGVHADREHPALTTQANQPNKSSAQRISLTYRGRKRG